MPGNFIVIFKPNVSMDRIKALIDEVEGSGGSVTNVYDSVQKGFAATIPDEFLTTLQSLQDDEIDYIEPDGVVTTQ